MRGINHAEDFGWSSAPRFGGGGGGTTSTNTIQNSDPWVGQQGSLTSIYNQAGGLDDIAQEGGGPQYFPGNTYAPLTGSQQGLISNMIGTAGTGGATDNAASASLINGALNPEYTQGTSNAFNESNGEIGGLGSGSQINLTQPAYNAGQGYLSNTIGGSPTLNSATGAYGTGNNYLNSTLNGTSPDQSYYSNMVSGANLNPFTAPGFQSVVNNTLASVMPSVESSFIGGNREDSGLATAAATSAATNAIGGLANQNYVQEQGLQQSAAQQQGAQQQAAAGQVGQNLTAQQQLQASAEAQAASNQGTALNTTLGAGSLASNNLLTQQGNALKGAAAAPIVDQGITSDIGSALSTAGSTQQDQQNQINAQIQAYNYGQLQPWNDLSLYENAITGTGNPGSSSSGTATQPYYSNTAAQVGSLAAGLGSLGLLAFSAFSDRDLKTDIDEIGETHSGFPLYTFRYKWEGPMSRHIGVMAQDVEKTRPHAVIHTPVGRMVNYMEALAV